MAVPYHTHTFEIPTATKSDVEAGMSGQLVVTPAALGTAAASDRGDFATKEQGAKADSALQPDDVGSLAGKDKIAIADINTENSASSAAYLRGDGTWAIPAGGGDAGDAGGGIPATRKIMVGNGLAGGGDLSADRTVSLSENTQLSLKKADGALQKQDAGALALKNRIAIADIATGNAASGSTYLRGDGTWATPASSGGSGGGIPATRKIMVGNGLTGGGDLSADRTVSLSENTQVSLKKADGALQKKDAGALALKSQIGVTDIKAEGTPSETTVYFGDGSWKELPAGGGPSGGMRKETYDPANKNADAFNQDNMVDGVFNKNFMLEDKAVLYNMERDYVPRRTQILAGAGLEGSGDLSADRTIALSAASLSSLKKAESALQLKDARALAVPAGAVMPFAMNKAPEGWLACDGTFVAVADYKDLFAAIGTAYGGGATGKFGLPDLRGEFIRGFDRGRGVDTGRVFGSRQEDAIQNITGELNMAGYKAKAGFNEATGAFYTKPEDFVEASCGAWVGKQLSAPAYFDASLIVRTANESRPRNIAMLYCIKY